MREEKSHRLVFKWFNERAYWKQSENLEKGLLSSFRCFSSSLSLLTCCFKLGSTWGPRAYMTACSICSMLSVSKYILIEVSWCCVQIEMNRSSRKGGKEVVSNCSTRFYPKKRYFVGRIYRSFVSTLSKTLSSYCWKKMERNRIVQTNIFLEKEKILFYWMTEIFVAKKACNQREGFFLVFTKNGSFVTHTSLKGPRSDFRTNLQLFCVLNWFESA